MVNLFILIKCKFILPNQSYSFQSSFRLIKWTFANTFSSPRNSWNSLFPVQPSTPSSIWFLFPYLFQNGVPHWPFEFVEQPVVARSQIRGIRWLRNDMNRVCGKQVAKNQRSMTWCINGMKGPSCSPKSLVLFHLVGYAKKQNLRFLGLGTIVSNDTESG